MRASAARASLGCGLVSACCFVCVCSLWQPATLLQSALKPLPVLSLAVAAAVWRLRALAAQMLLYAVADAVFEASWGEPFAATLFALGHLVFVLQHASIRSSLSPPKPHTGYTARRGLPFVVAGLVLAVEYRIMSGQCTKMLGAVHVALYGTALTCLAAMAAVHSATTAVGAAFFSASDLVIVHCLVCTSCPEPLRTLFVMATYWTGCTLLFKGSSSTCKPC